MRKIDRADGEAVMRFLNEAVRELWAGNIKVTYDAYERAAYTFFHRGLYVMVVTGSYTLWAQVEFENIEDLGGNAPGILERLREAVSAPERRARSNRRTKAELSAMKESWYEHHKRRGKGAEKIIRGVMEA